MKTWNDVHPRPRLRRERFLPLSGPWTLNGHAIRLPFPPESPASGYAGDVGETLHYETVFTLPEGFLAAGERLLLHFGAVDQIADVSLNGQHAVHHEGGYLPFCADVTTLLRPGENRLTVEAVDTLDPTFPHGKQSAHPHGMWYTPVSGIWQTVWLEPVPEQHITALRVKADLGGVDLKVEGVHGPCKATVGLQGVDIADVTFMPGDGPCRIDIPGTHRLLWSPENPVLYDLTLRAGADTVHSYFALRTVSVCKDAKGHERICLNGSPVFLNGVLDQGYFPEGVFLPESPEGYEQDVLRMKRLGFNLLRKHIKVEPETFYHACDRLGMLVMQDMVSGGRYSFLLDTALPTLGLPALPRREKPAAQKERFEQHLRDTVAHLADYPCIIGWTLFNEGWGQYDTERLYRLLKALDPTRFVDAASGWFKPDTSDVDSVHVYFRTKRLRPGKRPLLLSECGGYGRPVEGHLYKQGGHYSYGKATTAAELTAAIVRMYEDMVLPAIPKGLCGVVYTQLSDVEGEINGLYTYDRAVCKVEEAPLHAVLARATETLLANLRP